MNQFAVRASALLLACTMLTPAAAAAQTPFRDLKPEDYYYSHVLEMYETNVVSGMGNGTFAPKNHTRRAEALSMLCKLAGVDTRNFAVRNTGKWYDDVAGWAIRAGLLAPDADPAADATREEIARYIVGVYQLSLSPNTTGFTDTKSPYANTLKDLAIVAGSYDLSGNLIYGGDQKVIRGDLCIMLNKVRSVAQKPDWSSLKPIDAPLPAPAKPASVPTSPADYQQLFSWLMYNGLWEYEDTRPLTVSSTEEANALINGLIDNMSQGWKLSHGMYYEHLSFYRSYRFSASTRSDYPSGQLFLDTSIEMVPTDDLLPDYMAEQHAAFVEECDRVITELYQTGKLSVDMTDKEKALVLFRYVDHRFAYDLSYHATNAWASMQGNRGVCANYTAVFNALCHRIGIPVYAVTGTSGSGGPHAWSAIDVDGETYYIDVTWGDPLPDRPNYSNTDYFWITWDRLQQLDPGRIIDK